MAAFVKLVAATGAVWKAENLPEPPASDLVLELYDRERAALERYLRLLGCESSHAGDIVHDAFLKLHEHLTSAGDRTNLRAWLYRVVHNQAQNRRRAAANRTEDISAMDAQLAAVTPSPEELILSRERERRIRAAIADLTPVQRNCVLLRAQGLRYREIASILQVSTSSVGETVQRAIEKVRELL